MAAFDYGVLTIIGISIGLGWWRGFVYELLSLLFWIAAYVVARMFSPDVLPYVPDVIANNDAKSAVAYGALFVLTLMVGSVLTWLLSKLIKIAGLGLIDGLMGAVFGLIRGMLIVLILVLLAGLTELPKKTFWRDAWSSQTLQSVALFTKEFLPQDLAKKVSY